MSTQNQCFGAKKKKKNITILHLKIIIFSAVKYLLYIAWMYLRTVENYQPLGLSRDVYARYL